MTKKCTLHDLPEDERLRERLKRVGIDNLSLQELLALIIEKGKKGGEYNVFNLLKTELSDEKKKTS